MRSASGVVPPARQQAQQQQEYSSAAAAVRARQWQQQGKQGSVERTRQHVLVLRHGTFARARPLARTRHVWPRTRITFPVGTQTDWGE